MSTADTVSRRRNYFFTNFFTVLFSVNPPNTLPSLSSRHAFRHVEVQPFFRDEGRHLAVFDAADPDALPEQHIEFLARLGIGRVENVVAVDVEAARPAPAL